MAQGKTDIIGLVAVAALVFLFWRLVIRKKPFIIQPEPATTVKEVEDQFRGDPDFNLNDYCQNIVYQPLANIDLKPASMLGRGWCSRGDRSVIDDSRGFGDAYADEQANKYIAMKEAEAVMINNKLCLQFKLVNTLAVPITATILDTTQDAAVFDGTDEGGGPVTVYGVVYFNGTPHISLSSPPDVTGSKTIKFNLYLDEMTSIMGVILYFSSDVNDNLRVSLQNNNLYITPGLNPAVGKKYDITNFIRQKIAIEIIKTASVIASFSIDGEIQTEVSGVVSAIDAIGGFIGHDPIVGKFNNGSIWDVEITGEHKWDGHPDGDTDAAWADSIGSIDGTVTGIATTRNL